MHGIFYDTTRVAAALEMCNPEDVAAILCNAYTDQSLRPIERAQQLFDHLNDLLQNAEVHPHRP